MRKLLLMVAILAACTGISAQDIIKSDNIPDFKKVFFSGNMNVVMERSDKGGIEITLNDISLDRLDWKVVDGRLEVRLRPSSPAQRKGSAEVRVYYTVVSSVEATGASVSFAEPLDGGLFRFGLTSGGTLTADVDAADLTLDVDGNSSASIEGSAKYLDVTASKKSRVEMGEFEARSATVKARYGAHVSVKATERLEILSATGSQVYYVDSPEILKVDERSFGKASQAVIND